MLQWLFVPGVAVVVLSGIGWDLIVQGIAPRWVGGLLNLVTSMGFACVMISCLAPRSGARAGDLVSKHPVESFLPQSRRRRRWCELSVVIENSCNRAATRVALAVVVVLMTMMTLEEPPAPFAALAEPRLGARCALSERCAFRYIAGTCR